jgi:GNAT superfamily N-acetyltransferase
MSVEIRVASASELEQLLELDTHVSAEVMARKVAQGEVLVALDGGRVTGWLRHGYFWDSIPFMNMLTIQEPLRGRGIGARLVRVWEDTLHGRGYTEVLTSTLANERGQFFYRKLGYQDCGALLLPSEPLEIILRKQL